MSIEQKIKIYSQLSRSERLKTVNKDLKKSIIDKLSADGQSVCFGALCNGQIKPMGDFSSSCQKNICKKCNAHNSAQSYAKHGKNYRIIKYSLKKGQKCEICGCDDIDLLEFDHLNPDLKTGSIGHMQNPQLILEEANQTRLLCIWCHRLRTQEQINNKLQEPKSPKSPKLKIKLRLKDDIPKFNCNGHLCKGQLVSIYSFYKRNDQIRQPCKNCRKDLDRVGHKTNADYIKQLKINIGQCQMCEKKVSPETTCCFDFDHITEIHEKNAAISQMARTSRNIFAKIDDEVKRCRLLCCLCHKKRTIQQLNYKKPEEIEKVIKLKTSIKEELENNKCFCIDCGVRVSQKASLCAPCCKKKWRIVENRPSLVQIYKDLNELGSYVQVGKKYGVSDNAVRKWIKGYTEKNIAFNGEKIKLKLKKP